MIRSLRGSPLKQFYLAPSSSTVDLLGGEHFLQINRINEIFYTFNDQ